MRNILLIAFTVIGFNNLFGQDFSFEYTATMKAEVQFGKEWDYSYSTLNNPINISLKDNKLLMIYESGKVFWDLDIIKIIKTKETIENGKITEQHLALEYKEKNDFTGYLIFEYKYDFGDDYYTLKTPFIINGWVFSYYYYSN